jgi:hypothetical protein
MIKDKTNATAHAARETCDVVSSASRFPFLLEGLGNSINDWMRRNLGKQEKYAMGSKWSNSEAREAGGTG